MTNLKKKKIVKTKKRYITGADLHVKVYWKRYKVYIHVNWELLDFKMCISETNWTIHWTYKYTQQKMIISKIQQKFNKFSRLVKKIAPQCDNYIWRTDLCLILSCYTNTGATTCWLNSKISKIDQNTLPTMSWLGSKYRGEYSFLTFSDALWEIWLWYTITTQITLVFYNWCMTDRV